MNRFGLRPLVILLGLTSSMMIASRPACASAFQLWEQDSGNIGTYHAGYAALANDATTAFYNPAGISRIKNQQLVVGSTAILSDFKFQGSVTLGNQLPELGLQQGPPQNVTDQGGQFALVPALNYAAPINDRVGFGFSIVAPFGLKTDYGSNTALRYAATLSSIMVADISPALSFQVTRHFSVGAGFDIQRAYAELDAVGASPLIPDTDTTSTNKAQGTGYGFHLGGLYEFSPDSRIGLSYHSQVVHHLKGSSTFEGPLADALNQGPLRSNNAWANITLPPYTALSFYQVVHPQLALMASVIYTQWSVFKSLSLHNVAGAITGTDFDNLILPSTSIVASIPEFYRNTWNVSVGGEYFITDNISLRAGAGFDQSPARDAYRNAQLPDNDRYVIAFGGHFKATKNVGIDVGWAHFFIPETNIAPPDQVIGAQVVSTQGNVRGGADVLGAQVVWDIV